MTTRDMELQFQLETIQVSEVSLTSDDWSGDGVQKIEDQDLKEMVDGDPKPLFVEFISLYEGVSGNNREYTKDAVESCVKAMLGVNMYKGHEEPGTAGWKYREPVGKIVAAQSTQIVVDGKRVHAAKGKAYITEADPKLRSDIVKKMAGPLSILGSARAVRELGNDKRTITYIHNPLKSIDFCNPGTNGMALAGVTAVVREMSGSDVKSDSGAHSKDETMGKLTKTELLSEYGSVITEIVGEQIGERLQEVASEKKALFDLKSTLDAAKAAHETAISEMKAQLGSMTKERDTLKNDLVALEEKVKLADLKEFAASKIAEMKASDDHEEKVVEMASEDLQITLVGGDLEKSKAAFTESLKKSIEKTERLIEMVGGSSESVEEKTRRHNTNQQRGKKAPSVSNFLSPTLLKTGADNKK